MQATPKPITPVEVFQQADAFYRAIDQLHRTSVPEGVPQIAIPLVVLSAFASELFLKCLIYLETGQTEPIRLHLLWDLFAKLTPATQQRLRDLWQENATERKDVLDRLDASAGKTLPRDLDSNLQTGSDAFRLVRYLYEGGADFDFLLSDLPRPLRRVILEMKPEWSPPGEWINVKMDVAQKFLGADVELQDGSSARIGADQSEEKLFKETKTGTLFDAYEMISILLMKTNTRKQDLIKPAAIAEAISKGSCVGRPSLEMTFTPNVFELCLGNTPRDIKRIVFDVELTVSPQAGG